MDTPTVQHNGESLPDIETLRQSIDAYIDKHRPLGRDIHEPSIVAQHLRYLDEQYSKYEARLMLLLLQPGNNVETQAYLQFAYDIRIVIRDVYYERLSKEAWDLPPMSAQLHSMSWNASFKRARTVVAARLDWVLTMRAADQEYYPYLANFRDDDLALTINEELFRQRLPREYRWLVDFSNRPSLEWIVFIQHVARLTRVEARVGEFLGEVDVWVWTCCRRVIERDVDSFTERADAEDRAKCNDSCIICGHDFAYNFDVEKAHHEADEAEIAIKIKCGHVFGRSCLQKWVRTCAFAQKMTTCPACRMELKDASSEEIECPEEVTAAVQAFESARRAAARYDRDIDEFLIWGFCDSPAGIVSEKTINIHNRAYEHKIGDLLHNLEAARLLLDRSIDRVLLAVRDMLGPSYADESEQLLPLS